MSAIYGHRWLSAYGDADGSGAETWLRGLGALTEAELEAGLAACIERGEAWPPTLPEFRALCRPPARPASHRVLPALPRPRPRYDQVRPYLQHLRRLLGGGHRA